MWAERERSGKRSGAGGKWGERERSGERAKSAAQSPLTPTLRWFSDWYLTLTYRSALYYSISILALIIFQIIIYCTLACSLLMTYWNMSTKCITDVFNSLLSTPWSNKKQNTKLLSITSLNNAYFQNSFTVTLSRKFAINLSLQIPSQLNGVATLPCEISVYKNRVDWKHSNGRRGVRNCA